MEVKDRVSYRWWKRRCNRGSRSEWSRKRKIRACLGMVSLRCWWCLYCIADRADDGSNPTAAAAAGSTVLTTASTIIISIINSVVIVGDIIIVAWSQWRVTFQLRTQASSHIQHTVQIPRTGPEEPARGMWMWMEERELGVGSTPVPHLPPWSPMLKNDDPPLPRIHVHSTIVLISL